DQFIVFTGCSSARPRPAPPPDQTLSAGPESTRRAVPRAIQAKHRAPARAVMSTPRAAALVWPHSPSAGTLQASRVVAGIARVAADASHSRCTDALAPPRAKAQARLPRKTT